MRKQRITRNTPYLPGEKGDKERALFEPAYQMADRTKVEAEAVDFGLAYQIERVDELLKEIRSILAGIR